MKSISGITGWVRGKITTRDCGCRDVNSQKGEVSISPEEVLDLKTR